MGALPGLVFFLYLVCFISVIIFCNALAYLLIRDTRLIFRVVFITAISFAISMYVDSTNLLVNHTRLTLLTLILLAGASVGFVRHQKAKQKIQMNATRSLAKLSMIQVGATYLIGLVIVLITFCLLYFVSFYLFPPD